ncbi:mucin-2-like [Liolophura sinensis]|uniref:mucin-2-like n=1 Tax=Liolophura sinensis TaxID=3198878 RepID=UPI0031592A2A
MSRRNELKVPKYAFIKFACDGKTLQTKTKDLVSEYPLAVNLEVKAPWENKLLLATILGLSDDPTILTDIERKYMKSLKTKTASKQTEGTCTRLPAARPLKRNIARKTITIKDRLKRKATQEIVFHPNKLNRPSPSVPSKTKPHAFDFSRLTGDMVDKVQRLVEKTRSGCYTNLSPSTTLSSPPSTDPPAQTFTSPIDSAPSTLTRLTSPSVTPSSTILPTPTPASSSPPVFPVLSPTSDLPSDNQPSPFLSLLTSSDFSVNLPTSDRPTLFNMDTCELTTGSPTDPLPFSVTPPPSSVTPPTSDHAILPNNGPSHGLDIFLAKFDELLDHVRRLESKVDGLKCKHACESYPNNRPLVETRSFGTQTDAEPRLRPEPEPVQSLSTVDDPTDKDASPSPVDLPVPEFTDS